jgi:CRP-like cAMP-binding protein
LNFSEGVRPSKTLSAGAIVGERAMIDKAPRSATAIAKTNCRLVPVDEKRFQFMVAQTSSFALHVMRVIVDRLRQTTERATGQQCVEGN